jgi:pimeloyl-ACP methyl ester carboxylesterase
MSGRADKQGGAGAFVDRWWKSPDGLDLYARDYAGAAGTARLPVVCLHGLTRNSKDFDEVAAYVATAGRRIIVPDVRGRGRSAHDPQPMNYVPRTYARDVAGLLRALGVERGVFLGTSMGGLITMLMALTNGSRVAAAILNDVGPVAAPEGLARIAAYAGQPVAIDTWDDAMAYVRRINGAAFPNWSDEDWRDFARRTFREEGGKPVRDYDPAISEPIKAGRLKPVPLLTWFLFRRLARKRRLLVLRGQHSDILSSEIAARMQRRARGMKLVEIDGVGHAPMLTEPTAKSAILDFLDEMP